ncbi:hypothetical protein C1645_736558 [Glomus cerebriforme]|uniref:Uncharacterized protein n=1 Tax=Glomus cerebriforme TaxID=658196 RepID=A0A397TB72_9GLOM|nr:hypothetical protein C1645_736558 [Glomus cerebriforme]
MPRNAMQLDKVHALRKHRQIAEEAEKQKLAQNDDNNSDYKDISFAESEQSEQRISNHTISDNNNIIDEIANNIDINERSFSKKKNLQIKIQDLKQVEYGNSLKKLKIMLKLFVKLKAVKNYFHGVHHITKGTAASYLDALQKANDKKKQQLRESQVYLYRHQQLQKDDEELEKKLKILFFLM